MGKKIKFLICLLFLLVFFSANFCSAVNLEVKYPELSTGSKITDQTTIPLYFRYIFDFLMFVGFFSVFLSLIWAGVLYFISPVKPDSLSLAKDRAFGAISGLVLIVCIYLIVTTINPALAFFSTVPLKKTPQFPPAPQTPGVYFYKKEGCPPPDTIVNASSIPILQQNLINRITSVKTIHDKDNNIFYVSILYENPGLSGKCLFIDPNKLCTEKIENFASSVSINKYSTTAYGKITFYRNANFTPDGGYLTIQSSDIQGYINNKKIFSQTLESLKFTGSLNSSECNVPVKDQDCVLWDNKGICQKRECPNLSGKNIGSAEIDGKYLVLFVYYDENKNNSTGPWTFCQEFPTSED